MTNTSLLSSTDSFLSSFIAFTPVDKTGSFCGADGGQGNPEETSIWLLLRKGDFGRLVEA